MIQFFFATQWFDYQINSILNNNLFEKKMKKIPLYTADSLINVLMN